MAHEKRADFILFLYKITAYIGMIGKWRKMFRGK